MDAVRQGLAPVGALCGRLQHAQVLRVLLHERAAELEAFVADDSTQIARFLGRMVDSAPNAFGVVFGKKRPERDPLAEMEAARKIDAGEQQWLDAHIEADGVIDAYERALIAFLAEEV